MLRIASQQRLVNLQHGDAGRCQRPRLAIKQTREGHDEVGFVLVELVLDAA